LELVGAWFELGLVVFLALVLGLFLFFFLLGKPKFFVLITENREQTDQKFSSLASLVITRSQGILGHREFMTSSTTTTTTVAASRKRTPAVIDLTGDGADGADAVFLTTVAEFNAKIQEITDRIDNWVANSPKGGNMTELIRDLENLHKKLRAFEGSHPL